ncbi:hypothetical protein [Lysinibacillus fusiformis]|uniref:hypothetical protein n=1 Tax=Lysinibacillus fusiformis TaxID=28031 RepID=UPI00263B853C|nr:hypothetical protein [Lysinibacillus fusiformis]MDC6267330.1 hypothetical protein [Lysinibacillus sphaericus]MDN4968236.1 hypothetical protein [Lysinibacillus fusiformis]MDN4968410.1 hypothetical protein [Lysinibacillus fusiformis]
MMNQLKLVVNNAADYNSGVSYNKYEVYNSLLQMSNEVRDECINNINKEYGFELVDKYDFARYEISVNNSDMEVKAPVLFTPSYSKEEVDYYKDQMKELQKGYMKLLAN